MKLKLAVIGILAAVVAGVFASFDHQAAAQGQPPEIKAISYQGNVTVAGEIAPFGMQVTARVGGYESLPATIGENTIDGRYVSLTVNAGAERVGQAVEFWLDGQIKADQEDVFAPRTSGGQPCPGCSWTLPISRTLDLSFPDVPVATPTPTLTPMPTEAVVLPSFYSGRVVAGSDVPPDGTEIRAEVGDYISRITEISDGRFSVVVNPVSDAYVGQPVSFYIGSERAFQTVQFQPEVFREDLNLVFEELPPAPTQTPGPTATPEATRTPTATVPPTPTATATATPTEIPDSTATPEPNGGGFCSARSGGPAGLGHLGLLLTPLMLAAWRRMRSRSEA
ncbi:MAG: hypothetical protein WD208_13160 [Dehalococcoidia bacterium]